MTPYTIHTANTIGAKQNKVYPNEVTVDDLTALEQAMRRDHVCAKYTCNERGIANFQYADCIPMDCDNDHSENPDNWKGPEDVQKAYPQFDANAPDAGRFLFGVENPQVMYFKGKKTVNKLFILAGGRNGALHKKACQLIKRYGEAEARAHFDTEAAKCVPPVQQELDAIWHSARKYGREMCGAEGYIPPEQFGALQEYLKKLKPEDNKAYRWSQ